MADEELSVQITAIDRASEVFANLAKGSDNLMQSITGLLTPAKLLGSLFGYELVSQLQSCITQFVEFSSQVRNLTFMTGASVEQVSYLVNGLTAMGVESGMAERAITQMSRAVESGNPALNAMRSSIENSNGTMKTGVDLFYGVIDGLQGMTDATQRDAAARTLFGRSWTDMIPIIAMGSDGLKTLGESINRVASAEDLQNAQNYKIAMSELGLAIDALKEKVGGGILVPITMYIKYLTQSGNTDTSMRAALNQASGLSVLDLMGGTALSSTYNDPSLTGQQGTPDTSGASGPSSIFTLQANLITAQIAKLNAQTAVAMAAAYQGQGSQLQASLDAREQMIDASAQVELAQLALTHTKEKTDDTLYASQRNAIYAKANADKLVAIQASGLQANALQEKIESESYDATQYMDGKELVAAAEKNTDLQGLMSDNAAAVSQIQLAGIAENEQNAKDAYDKLYYLDGSNLQAQITGAAVTQSQILTSWQGAYSRLGNLYSTDRSTYQSVLQQDLDALNAMLANGTISQQTYYIILANLRKTDQQASDKDIADRLTANGIAINQQLANEAKYNEDAEKIRQTNLKNQAIDLTAQADATGKMWLAVQAGAVTAYASMKTLGQETAQATVDAWKAVDTNLQTGFFDVMTGNFSDLGNVAKKFGDDLINIFAKVLADEATQGLKNLLPSIGTGLASAASTVLSWFSQGGVVPGSGTDTVPAMLTPGEVVLKPDLAAQFLNLVNSFTGSGTAGMIGGQVVTYADLAANPELAYAVAQEGTAGMVAAGSASLGSYAGEAGSMAAAMSDAGATAAAPALSAGVLAIPGIVMGISELIQGMLYKPLTPDQLSESWGVTMLATLTNFGGLQGAIDYANSGSVYSIAYQSQLEQLNALRLNGPQTAQDVLDLNNINANYPGWQNLPGWDEVTWPDPYQNPTPEQQALMAQWAPVSPDTSAGQGGNAAGIVGYTSGPTNMLVGEAGIEAVAVIRNPRQVDLAAAGGQGGETHYHFSPQITGTFIGVGGKTALARELIDLMRGFLKNNMGGATLTGS